MSNILLILLTCFSFLEPNRAALPPVNNSQSDVSSIQRSDEFVVKPFSAVNNTDNVDLPDDNNGQTNGLNVITNIVRKTFTESDNGEESENDSNSDFNSNEDNEENSKNSTADYEISEEEEEEVTATPSATVLHINDTIKVLTKWSQLIETFLMNTYKEVLPMFMKLEEDVQLSTECTSSLLMIISGLIKQQPWAFRLIDAFGRIPAGFIDGTLTEFGEYDECLEVEFPRAEEEDTQSDSVVGKYCLLRAHFPLPATDLLKLKFTQPVVNLTGTRLQNTVWSHLTKFSSAMYTLKGFRFGLCLPSTCSAKEIENLINKVLGSTLAIPFTVGPEAECDTKNDTIQLTIFQKISLTVYAIMAILVLTGTSIEIHSNLRTQNPGNEKEANNYFIEVLLCFSALRNTRELFHVKQHKSSLSVVHGLRVLSMLWIIVGHTYLFGAVYRFLFAFKRLLEDIPKYPGRIQYQALNNSYLCVDSFFFISGLVLVYVSLPILQKTKGRFNYLLYVAHRWMRMTPALIGLILFIYLFPFFGDGPVFKHHVNSYVNSCERNWWYDLLFISNWYSDIPGMCAEQVWFIGADFQIYLFAPLIFLTYYRSETLGLLVNIGAIVVGIISAGLSAYITGSGATFTLDHISNQEYLHFQLNTSYLPTYQHIAPYCIGMLCGFLILKYGKDTKQVNIPIVWQSLLWIALPSGSLYAMFYTYRWNNYMVNSQPSMFTIIAFASMQRTLWCIGIAWITFACAVGKASLINDFLSAKQFVPFSRLSFCVFLMHLTPILLRAFSVKFTRNWDDHTFLSWAAMNVLLSTIAAFVLYTLFEAPFHRLEKMVFRSNNSQRKQTSANNELRATNVECSERSNEKSSISMRL